MTQPVLGQEQTTYTSNPVATPRDACANCGTAMVGAFCSACGQRDVQPDPTFREFLRDATLEVLQWDGKIPMTLRALLREPGRLTRDFLEGRRARWLSPLRVYLICSVAFFLSGPLIESVTHRSTAQQTRFIRSERLTPEVRARIAEGVPARIFGEERLIAAFERGAVKRISTAYPKVMVVLLPLFALLTFAAWRRRAPHYPSHLYFALHLHAALFAALTVDTLLSGFLSVTGVAIKIVGALSGGYLLWYSAVAMRRVFRESWPATIVKGLIVAAAYTTSLYVTSLLVLGLTLWAM